MSLKADERRLLELKAARVNAYAVVRAPDDQIKYLEPKQPKKTQPNPTVTARMTYLANKKYRNQ